MTRLLLVAAALAGSVAFASPASAECDVDGLKYGKCCIAMHDYPWCTPEIEPVCVYPYDGGWCVPWELASVLSQ